MDRKRIGEIATGIAGLFVAGVILFSFAGGWGWLFGEKDKSGQEAASEPAADSLCTWNPKYRACADGTLYMTGNGGKVFWLVAGKAMAVECSESIDTRHSCGDIKGGVYVRGEKHLWYLYKGVAAQVEEVPMNQIPEREHRVTTMSVNWSVLQSYGEGAYEAGLEASESGK
jgi:hypothetical protein